MTTPTEPHPLAVEAATLIGSAYPRSHALHDLTVRRNAEGIDRTCRVTERERLLENCRALLGELRHEVYSADFLRIAALLARLDARETPTSPNPS